MKRTPPKTDDELISDYMRRVAKARWDKLSPEERRAQARERVLRHVRQQLKADKKGA